MFSIIILSHISIKADLTIKTIRINILVMIEKLSTKTAWIRMTVGQTTLKSAHLGDSVRIPNSMYPVQTVETILPDGQLLSGGGYVAYTSGRTIEIFCPHKHK